MFAFCSLFHTLGGVRLGLTALQPPYQIRPHEQTSYNHSKNLKNLNEMLMFVWHKFQILPLSSYFLKYRYSFQTQTTSSIYSRCGRETPLYDYSIHQQMATSSGYYDTSSQRSTSSGQPTHSSGRYLLLCRRQICWRKLRYCDTWELPKSDLFCVHIFGFCRWYWFEHWNKRSVLGLFSNVLVVKIGL